MFDRKIDRKIQHREEKLLQERERAGA